MILITNRHLCSRDRYIEVLKVASYNGVDKIILREKDLSDSELEKLYYTVKSNINKNCKIIINSNINVYKKVEADGIHLPYKMYIEEYENIKNSNIIGISTHSIEEILSVSENHATYVIFSHIYNTRCKENAAPKGIDMLREAKLKLKNSKLKLVALGGILHSNADETLKHCDDIAVMSSIMNAKDVASAVNGYLNN